MEIGSDPDGGMSEERKGQNGWNPLFSVPYQFFLWLFKKIKRIPVRLFVLMGKQFRI